MPLQDPHPTYSDVRFSAAEFLRMAQSGAFTDMTVELVAGRLKRRDLPMSGHSAMQAKLIVQLASAVSPGRVFGTGGIVLDDSTVVLCDAALSLDVGTEDRFLTPNDILLVVEIAQTMQGRDMGLKRKLYAQANIPTYWVIDGVRRVVHVYADPVEGDYSSVHTVRFGAPLAVPGSDAAITLD
ncbi:Uma2 family endonuclease [uncultured Sphingomonas sp.]|uniref:Uma2 family endonuclease n=1 Tax=uncultured Sphingomonas sp. TaxID=158754 RepID=UPI0025FE0847|nr:Uma2 family endonuclease [uncultured Sphingomonas sp.]